jgi:predicted O-methyltransferase YrrM
MLIIIVTQKTKDNYYDIHPENVDRKIFDEIKYKYKEPLIMSPHEYYFVNGLIRLYKPKKLLEIGVCSGGMSAAILNSINIKKIFI